VNREPKKILLIGPYPPPEGGISIHIKRLLLKSHDYPEIELAAFDIRKGIFMNSSRNKKSIFHLFRFFFSSEIVHIHISHPFKSLIGRVVKLFGKKLFFTVHNVWSLKMRSTKALINMSDQVIFVRYSKQFPAATVIPAYISPEEGGEISPDLKNALVGNRVIVSINTSPKSHSAKPDEYGFDILLNAIAGINSTEKLIFVLVDVNGTYEAHYKMRVDVLNSTGANIRVLYLNTAVDFPALMKCTNVYVRATRTDGDSVAIREALAAGVTVLVNKTNESAEDCILFSENDLSEKIIYALTQKRVCFEQPDFSDEIFKLYTQKNGKTESAVSIVLKN
jgi:glycosyltransferase involved in cell wall biosynthesis